MRITTTAIVVFNCKIDCFQCGFEVLNIWKVRIIPRLIPNSKTFVLCWFFSEGAENFRWIGNLLFLSQRPLCAFLWYDCERSTGRTPRCRGRQIRKEPKTLGGHLRKCRLQLKIFQTEAAHRLKVSIRTLSLWECDRYSTWLYWPRIVECLGCNPFTDPTRGRSKLHSGCTTSWRATKLEGDRAYFSGPAIC